MKKQLITLAALAGGFVLGASALVALADWSAPLSSPPTCTAGNPGCDAPINVGAVGQMKTGLLSLGNFQFVPPGMPKTGIQGQTLTATDNNGDVDWSNGGIPSNIVAFNGSDTWTAPAGVTKVRVRAWGGGGGGGGSSDSDGQGGGGGGGGYAESIVTVLPKTDYSVTVGTGGGGYLKTTGGMGGNSSFGTLVVAQGGNGGGDDGDKGGKSAGGSGGGASSVGAVILSGVSGQSSGGNGQDGGWGGSSPYGGQGGMVPSNSGVHGSIDGVAPGGGGSGAGNAGSSVAGGRGANGEVIIEY